MKKILLCLSGLTLCFSVLSQNVSIELSVHWRIEKDIFNENTIMNTPIIHITYRNNGNENIYFKKISLPDKVGVPNTGYGLNMNMPTEMRFDRRRRAENSLKMIEFTEGNNYRVEIGDFQHNYGGGWNIINEMDTCTDGTLDLINDNISDIHEYIYHKKYPEERFKISTKFGFNKEDLSEDSILNANSIFFVFLKSNETYTDTFNIIAFQLMKGNYIFTVGENIIPDFVYINPIWDDKQKKYIDQIVKLPKDVGIYKLYSGKFYTNMVKMSFRTPVERDL